MLSKSDLQTKDSKWIGMQMLNCPSFLCAHSGARADDRMALILGVDEEGKQVRYFSIKIHLFAKLLLILKCSANGKLPTERPLAQAASMVCICPRRSTLKELL